LHLLFAEIDRVVWPNFGTLMFTSAIALRSVGIMASGRAAEHA
jgi:hypothetical protein